MVEDYDFADVANMERLLNDSQHSLGQTREMDSLKFCPMPVAGSLHLGSDLLEVCLLSKVLLHL